MIQLQELVERVVGPVESEHKRGIRILQRARHHLLFDMTWDVDCWQILCNAIDVCILGDALEFKRRYGGGR